ncbi:MFS transporter [Schleiferilactobacillus harbinensis]|mgnify:FL=1|jgi:predicted MFS family arabinose efflux permease|uniref:MFS transporter n=1 Tax=Schleiferilactobacillus harbinensis TaxID=304207 RepID=A0A5P8M4V5_9LACO|nr:MFS transporter [Schleiferilactobacillus harbinensis]MBO3092011.1 MFS transporter [Schleiferilactobacillus harbinensis]MCI1687131.1 MFS transporter [Schleiferilactobacillus harbinensis]QFR23542.1 MFS transporter [Schleiferilactobacillus harbinensis]
MAAQTQPKKNGLLLQSALLSISLVLTSAYAISATLPAMQKAMPGQSLASLESLATVPTFSVTVMVLLSSWIARKLGAKNTVALGLLLVGVAGIVPAFTTNYPTILVSRILLGAGFGVFNSLAVSLLSVFFSGEKKAQSIGFQSAFQSIGNAAMTFVAGWLLTINWHLSYLVYLIAFPILILFWFFVPQVKSMESTDQTGHKVQQHINLKVIGLALTMLAFICIQAGFNVRIPTIVVDAGYGTATGVSTWLSVTTLMGMLVGFSFGMLHKAIHQYVFMIGAACMALGNLLAAYSSNLWLTGIGTVLVVGIGPTLLGSYAFNRGTEVVEAGSATLATSILLVGCNVGGFCAPYVMSAIEGLVHSSTNVLIVFGLFSLAMTVILGVAGMRLHSAAHAAPAQ